MTLREEEQPSTGVQSALRVRMPFVTTLTYARQAAASAGAKRTSPGDRIWPKADTGLHLPSGW